MVLERDNDKLVRRFVEELMRSCKILNKWLYENMVLDFVFV